MRAADTLLSSVRTFWSWLCGAVEHGQPLLSSKDRASHKAPSTADMPVRTLPVLIQLCE